MKGKRNTAVIWSLLLTFTILSGLPFLFEGFGFMILLAFTPLFCLEEVCRKGNVKHRGWYYVAAFYLFNIATTYWIWNVSPAGAIGAMTVNVIFMTILFRLFTYSRSICDRAGRPGSILPYLFFIFLWISWEHIYCKIELSWPWLVLGNAFATSPRLIQWYELTGVEGGSLWALSVSLAAYISIRKFAEGGTGKALIPISFTAAAIIVPALLSICRYYGYREKGTAVEMAAVQPNIDPFQKYGIQPQSAYDERLVQLLDSVVSPQTKYAITPETFTYDIDLMNPDGNYSYRRFSEFLSRHPGTSMILGSLTLCRYEDAIRPTSTARNVHGIWVDVFNSAIMMDGSDPITYSHKSKLVPGVEIIPYQDAFPFIGKICERFGGSSDSYGRTGKINALKGADGHIAAPMVCYESVYGDYVSRAVRDGADFLAVITNDGWWGNTHGYRQHFRFARLRSIENRRDLIHVANTGISGIINQRGDVLNATEYWVETAFTGYVHTTGEMTFFSKNGDIIGRNAAIPAAIALILIICLRFSGRKSLRGKSVAGRS